LAKSVTLTKESAYQNLEIACQKVGLNADGAELIRLGSNAVFRLPKHVIVRMARDGDSLGNAQKQVAVARWLENENYPAVRVLDVEQPQDVDGHATTFWQSVSEQEKYAPLVRVAELIRWLHRLDAPPSLTLPAYQPFAELEGRISGLSNLDPADASFMHQRIDEVRTRYSILEFSLKSGPIHGDANVGNVILDREDNPVVIDLDSFSIGHREWDLVQTALFYERFGWHTEEEYQTFVDTYGFDIMTWSGYPVLADYREISMTLWLCGKAGADERAAAEVRKRIDTIRSDGDRREWAPF
jgi:aminoglycoside phosphotransferase (APT) family kinase protein